MAKRVFVALKISAQLQEKILRWEERKNLPVSWQKDKNLHITIIPPWYCEEAENIKKLLDQAKGKFGSFTITFNRITLGPDPKEPRMIWIEGETPGQILDLKTFLEKLLGQKPVQRNFRLHLTLARFKPENFASFEVKHLDEKVDWEENAGTLVLMESRPSPEGSDYEILAEVSL